MVNIVNRGIDYRYKILDKFEAGINLKGFEVKSLRNNRGSLNGSYISIKYGEVYLINFQLPPYQPKNVPKDYDPNRPRKLLLKKNEIIYLTTKIKEKGLTIIPLRIYSKNNLIKIEIALAKGLKKFEKREKIKEKEFKKIKNKIEKTRIII
ncbi:MAG: SsrA-binding protein [Candidatus Parcubacteria bacterium]|nr:MAG: SsrA-binding protein [Candidatus Parcubacteria bacterium]